MPNTHASPSAPGEGGRGLSVERATAAHHPLTETVDYALAARACTRAGRALGGVRLDAMQFAWRDEAGGLLAVRLSASGAPDLTAEHHVAGHAGRARFPSRVD